MDLGAESRCRVEPMLAEGRLGEYTLRLSAGFRWVDDGGAIAEGRLTAVGRFEVAYGEIAWSHPHLGLIRRAQEGFGMRSHLRIVVERIE
jgi:hypothetical protein